MVGVTQFKDPFARRRVRRGKHPARRNTSPRRPCRCPAAPLHPQAEPRPAPAPPAAARRQTRRAIMSSLVFSSRSSPLLDLFQTTPRRQPGRRMPSLVPERSASARGTDRLGRMGRAEAGQTLRFGPLPRIGFGVVSARAVALGPMPDSRDRFRQLSLPLLSIAPGEECRSRTSPHRVSFEGVPSCYTRLCDCGRMAGMSQAVGQTPGCEPLELAQVLLPTSGKLRVRLRGLWIVPDYVQLRCLAARQPLGQSDSGRADAIHS